MHRGDWAPNWSMPSGSGDRWVMDYERGRPGWPREVLGVGDLPSSASVLEIAAGTGKLTRLLLPAFTSVKVVEPAKAMRERLLALCPDADVRSGSAEALPLDDASVDAVFVAEAFNHFDWGPALGEIARVLRPRGLLVVMWNLPAGPWEPTTATAEDLLSARLAKFGAVGYDPLDLGGPQYASREWARSFATSPFDELQETHFPNPQNVDRDGLVAFYASMGWIASLPDEERLPLLEQVRSLLPDAEYRRKWNSHVHWTRLRPI